MLRGAASSPTGNRAKRVRTASHTAVMVTEELDTIVRRVLRVVDENLPTQFDGAEGGAASYLVERANKRANLTTWYDVVIGGGRRSWRRCRSPPQPGQYAMNSTRVTAVSSWPGGR